MTEQNETKTAQGETPDPEEPECVECGKLLTKDEAARGVVCDCCKEESRRIHLRMLIHQALYDMISESEDDYLKRQNIADFISAFGRTGIRLPPEVF